MNAILQLYDIGGIKSDSQTGYYSLNTGNMVKKGQITHTDKYEITYTVIDHSDEGQSLPEENETVSWWAKGSGEPPYVGTMLDDDFPGLDYFFCWSNIPNPPEIFFTTYNINW